MATECKEASFKNFQIPSDLEAEAWQVLEKMDKTISCDQEQTQALSQIENEKTFACTKRLKEITLFVLQIILFPWGIYLLLRYMLERWMMGRFEQVQNRIYPLEEDNRSIIFKDMTIQMLVREGFVIRYIHLKKDAESFEALAAGHNEDSKTKNWVIQTNFTNKSLEVEALSYARFYHTKHFNLLLMNRRSLGKDITTATVQKLADALEQGISYVEMKFKAERIILAAHSLSGASLARAIIEHSFKPHGKRQGRHYMVLWQMVPNGISDLCLENSSCKNRCVKKLAQWIGVDIPILRAVDTLQQLKIQQVIIQATSSRMGWGVVPAKEAFINDGLMGGGRTLGYEAVQKKNKKGIAFCSLAGAGNDSEKAVTEPFDYL